MKKKQVQRTKSLWKANGFNNIPEGNELSKEMSKVAEKIYKKWLDKGYRPAEIREIMVGSTFSACWFVNMLRVD